MISKINIFEILSFLTPAEAAKFVAEAAKMIFHFYNLRKVIQILEKRRSAQVLYR